MKFLYPTSRQFPFDEVCEQIVRELEQRAWQVPGIRVKFGEFRGSRYVDSIEGENFKLDFGRGSGAENVSSVQDLFIYGEALSVYADESGPTFYRYVGDNWSADREEFFNGIKANSKMYGEPRTYLRYRGECRCPNSWTAGRPHTHTSQRSPFLAHDSDMGREYSPRVGEPTEFVTAEVMEEFRKYLAAYVLPTILRHSVPTTA